MRSLRCAPSRKRPGENARERVAAGGGRAGAGRRCRSDSPDLPAPPAGGCERLAGPCPTPGRPLSTAWKAVKAPSSFGRIAHIVISWSGPGGCTRRGRRRGVGRESVVGQGRLGAARDGTARRCCGNGVRLLRHPHAQPRHGPGMGRPAGVARRFGAREGELGSRALDSRMRHPGLEEGEPGHRNQEAGGEGVGNPARAPLRGLAPAASGPRWPGDARRRGRGSAPGGAGRSGAPRWRGCPRRTGGSRGTRPAGLRSPTARRRRARPGRRRSGGGRRGEGFSWRFSFRIGPQPSGRRRVDRGLSSVPCGSGSRRWTRCAR